MKNCATERRALLPKSALLLAIVTACAHFVPIAWAQEATASVNGTIQDSSGAVVPGAVITLVNKSTNLAQQTVSTQTGRYVFLGVPSGEYSLSVSKSGFARSSRESFNLDVDQTATVNFTLTVGATSTTVVVERPSGNQHDNG